MAKGVNASGKTKKAKTAAGKTAKAPVSVKKPAVAEPAVKAARKPYPSLYECVKLAETFHLQADAFVPIARKARSKDKGDSGQTENSAGPHRRRSG